MVNTFPIRSQTLDGAERGDGMIYLSWLFAAMPMVAYRYWLSDHHLHWSYTPEAVNLAVNPIEDYYREVIQEDDVTPEDIQAVAKATVGLLMAHEVADLYPIENVDRLVGYFLESIGAMKSKDAVAAVSAGTAYAKVATFAASVGSAVCCNLPPSTKM